MTGTLTPERGRPRPDALADPAPLGSCGGPQLPLAAMVGTGKYRSNGEMVHAIEPPAPRS